MDTEVRARLSANTGAFVSSMGQAAQSAQSLNDTLQQVATATGQATQSARGAQAANQQLGSSMQGASASSKQMAGNVQNLNQQAINYNRTIQRTNRFTQIASAMFAAGAVGLVTYARKSFHAAAAVSELDGTLVAIAKSTGNSHKELVDTARAIEAMGIEMASARQIATKFAQNNLDLAQAAKLARTAQDLAVVSQSNSTATLNRLIHGIMTGNSLVLRNAGVTGMAGKAYADYAKELGVVATALTPAQRQQAIINMIFREGEAVAGAYESAMLEAGKVLRSFPRIMNNITVAFGSTMNKGFAPVILEAYKMTKAFAEAINITPKLNKETGEVTEKVGGLTEGIRGLTYIFNMFMTPLQNAATYMKNFFDTATLTEEQVKRFIGAIEPVVPLLAAVATAFSGMGAKALLGMTPLKGLTKFIPTWAAGFAVFVLASDDARAALGRLFDAIQPLLPILAEFAQQAIQVFLVFADVATKSIIGVINGIAGFLNAVGATQDGAEAIARAARIVAIAFGLKTLAASKFGLYLTTKLWPKMVAFSRGALGSFRVGLTLARTSITNLKIAMMTMTPAMMAATAATNIFKVALRTLSTAVRGLMSATGIGLVVVVISLLVEAFISAYQSSEKFRDGVERVLNAVIGKVADTVNWIIRMANAVDRFFGGTGERFDEVDWKIELSPLDTSSWEDIKLPSLEEIFGGDIDESIQGVADELEDLGEVAGAAGAQVDYLAQAMERFRQRVKKVRETSKDFGRWSETITDFSDEIDKALSEVDYQTNEFNKTMADSATTGDELVASYRNMASAIRSQLSSALNTAKQRLSQLQNEFDQFQSKIAGAISGIIDFRAALPREQDSRVYTGFVKALGDSLGVLEAPAESATSFADNLRKQAEAAQDFSKKITTLLEMGLSKEALEQVINAGYEAGSAIADEIIAGGVTLVDDINKMVEVVNDMALETGEQGAKQFFQAGIDMGQALVDAIVGRIESERDRIEGLIDAIVARLEAIAKAEADAASAAAAAAAARKVESETNPFAEAAVDAKAIADTDWAAISRDIGSFGGYIPMSRSDTASAARLQAQADVAEEARISAARRAQAEARTSAARADRALTIYQTNNISESVDIQQMNNELGFFLKAAGY